MENEYLEICVNVVTRTLEKNTTSISIVDLLSM